MNQKHILRRSRGSLFGFLARLLFLARLRLLCRLRLFARCGLLGLGALGLLGSLFLGRFFFGFGSRLLHLFDLGLRVQSALRDVGVLEGLLDLNEVTISNSLLQSLATRTRQGDSEEDPEENEEIPKLEPTNQTAKPRMKKAPQPINQNQQPTKSRN